MIKTAIVGGSRKEAGELLRLLINHPDIEIVKIVDSTHNGVPVAEVHHGLIGDTDQTMTSDTDFKGVDVVFLCLPPGDSAKFIASTHIADDVKVIDLSPDFRADSDSFIYGLAELNRKPMVRGGKRVSSTGPVAMAVELALLPLAKEGLLESDINIAAIEPATLGQFALSYDNMSVASGLDHADLPEIKAMIAETQPAFQSDVNIVSLRGPLSRGLIAVAHINTEVPIEQIRDIYENYYDDHNFTYVSATPVTVRDVEGTNKCLLHLEKFGNKLMVTSVIDARLKGGSGNAVHLMNLLFGLHERTGLNLKTSSI